ncbi:MAG: ComEC/Rec2 family competence protein [Bacteroidota bacterium]
MPTPPPSAPPPAWGAVPLVPVAISYILGVLVADLLGFTPPNYWLAAAGGLALIIAGLQLRPAPQRWRATFTSGLLLLLAFTLAAWRTNASHPPGKASYFAHHLEDGDLLAGQIDDLKPGQTRMRAVVSLHHMLRDSTAAQPVSGKLYLYLPPDESTAELRIGDGVVFSGQPRQLAAPLNPHVFDFRQYAARQGIYHNVFLKTAEDWQLVKDSAWSLTAKAARWRRAWFSTFQQHLSGDQLAVAAALVMGERDGLSQEVKSAYAETGAIHVLAVSGLHVGIIFLILRFFLERVLKLNRSLAGRWGIALVSVGCIWAFALVSGLSASVQRAALMFTVLAFGNISYQKPDVFNVLAVTATGMLWYAPQQLFHLGFQLSFTAVIGIVLFTNHINRLVALPTKVLRSAWSAMAASTGAQLGTLPLSLSNFGQFPTYFLASGTLVIISAFLTMGAGLLLGLVGGLAPRSALAAALGWGLSGIVYLQNAFIFLFQGLPGGLLKVPVFPWYLAALLALGIGALAFWARWRKHWVGALGLLLCGVTIVWARTQVQGERQQAATVIYHVARGTLVDVHGPAEAFAFGQEPANLAFVAEGYRERFGYTPALTLPFVEADTILSPTVAWRPPILNVHGERWLVLSGQQPPPNTSDLADINLILITDDLSPNQLPELPAGTTPLLVIDGSTPPYRYADWRAVAARRGLSVWITGEQGAYRQRN